jgi:hypothetical protein
LPCAIDKLFARRRQRVACLPLFEEWKAERFLKRRDTPGYGCLAHAEGTASRQCAALVGNRKKVTKVVPVHHCGLLCARCAWLAFCNYAERYHNIVAYEN